MVKGFLVDASLPSPNLLKTWFPVVFNDTKIGNEVIKLVNGYFYNRLNYLRTKFYEIMKKYGVNVGFGYIVPYNKVDEFLKEFDMLKAEYEKYQDDFIAFLEEGRIPEGVRKNAKFDIEYIRLVEEYLKEKGASTITIPDFVNRVRIRLIPLVLDVSTVMDYIEEEVSERVEEEIEKTKNEIVGSIMEQINADIESILKTLENYKKKELNSAVIRKLRTDLKNIEAKLETLGIDPEKVRYLREAIDNVTINNTVTDDDINAVRAVSLRKMLTEGISLDDL